MKEVLLTQGQFTVVDDEDYDNVMRFRWQASRLLRAKTDCEYVAVRTCYCPYNNKKKHTIFMHRQILSCPQRMEVDHANRNQLDNRKENLRICTNMQNKQNGTSYENSSSRYKGVAWLPPFKWEAYIRVGKKKIHLGRFLDEREAALAYDVAARKHFKEFASTNF